MRSYLLTAAGASVAIFAAIAVYISIGWSPRSPLPPKVDVASKVALGTRRLGERVEASIEIANVGGQPLVLQAFGSNCSCASIEVTQDGQRSSPKTSTVQPGSKLTLYAEVVVRGTPGSGLVIPVWFNTNDPDCPRVQVALDIPQVRGLACTPSAVSMRTVLGSAITSTQIEVTNYGDALLALESATVDQQSGFAASIDPDSPRVLKGDGKSECARVKITFTGNSLGKHTATLSLGFRKNNEIELFEIPISCEVLPLYDQSPLGITLPRRGAGGGVYEAVVALRSNSGHFPSNVTVSSPHRLLMCKIEVPAESPTAFLHLSIDSNDRERLKGTHVVEVEVESGSNRSKLRVPVEILP